MKIVSKELDVDFIGGQGALTEEELQKISAYLKANRQLKATKTPKNAKQAKRVRQEKVYE